MPWEHCMELWQLELDFASLEILHCPGLDFTSSMAWTSRNPSLSIFTDTYFFAIKNFALQISLYYTLIDANTQRSFLIGRNSGGMSIFLPSSLVLLSYSTSWSIRWKNCSCCRDFVCTSPTRLVFPCSLSCSLTSIIIHHYHRQPVTVACIWYSNVSIPRLYLI